MKAEKRKGKRNRLQAWIEARTEARTQAPPQAPTQAPTQEWMAARGGDGGSLGIGEPGEIGEAELAELRVTLAPISESYLRRLLRESGVPLAPMVAGVRQSNLEELEESLIALAAQYEKGDASRRAAVRGLVITAKDHARWASRGSSRQADSKNEMILWMITWLENPPLFPQWVRLRRQRASDS